MMTNNLCHGMQTTIEKSVLTKKYLAIFIAILQFFERNLEKSKKNRCLCTVHWRAAGRNIPDGKKWKKLMKPDPYQSRDVINARAVRSGSIGPR